MARIALGGLQVTVVEFQLVGRTGMSKRMKDHFRQSSFFPEFGKLFQDDTILTGPAIGKRKDQIKFLVFVSQKASQFILSRFPLTQNIGKSFWQPDLTDTGISFWLFRISRVLVFGISGVKI